MLCVLPSFSPVRVMAVIEEMAPNRITWLFGVPHLVRFRWRLDFQRFLHESLVEPNHRTCLISTFDYRETLIALESIYRKRSLDYSLLVCSLGSKLQKVGQVLFHILRPEVGALVSIPRTWNPTRFGGDIVEKLYVIDLGKMDLLRENLNDARLIQVGP
jgi:hypothetical protein